MPAAYVEEQAPAPPPVKSKPAPPAPPSKRPIPGGGRKPAELQPRDSGMSLNGANGSSADASRSNTPTPSLGGSLADALLARQKAMQNKRDDEDDW